MLNSEQLKVRHGVYFQYGHSSFDFPPNTNINLDEFKEKLALLATKQTFDKDEQQYLINDLIAIINIPDLYKNLFERVVKGATFLLGTEREVWWEDNVLLSQCIECYGMTGASPVKICTIY